MNQVITQVLSGLNSLSEMRIKADEEQDYSEWFSLQEDFNQQLADAGVHKCSLKTILDSLCSGN